MYEPDALEVSHGESAVAVDDSARSFLPRHTACMPLPVLRALLLSQGIHIVGEADWAVLEATEAWKVKRSPKDQFDGSTITQWGDPLPVAEAVLARRAAKGE